MKCGAEVLAKTGILNVDEERETDRTGWVLIAVSSTGMYAQPHRHHSVALFKYKPLPCVSASFAAFMINAWHWLESTREADQK
jgi:hypothetical protein